MMCIIGENIFIKFLKMTNSRPTAKMFTNFGEIAFEFYPEYAPKAVENFLTHAKNGYYNGVIFHRVIRDFMIQGGDPTGTGMGGNSIWNRKFDDEFTFELSHTRGMLSMANAGRNTNGSQFFIVTTEDASFLDRKHTIFGKVIDGMEVVDDIERLPTDAHDRPQMEVIIEKIEVSDDVNA